MLKSCKCVVTQQQAIQITAFALLNGIEILDNKIPTDDCYCFFNKDKRGSGFLNFTNSKSRYKLSYYDEIDADNFIVDLKQVYLSSIK